MSEEGLGIRSSCSCPFEVMRFWSTEATGFERVAGWAARVPIEQMRRRITIELQMVAGSPCLCGSQVPPPDAATCLFVRQSLQD